MTAPPSHLTENLPCWFRPASMKRSHVLPPATMSSMLSRATFSLTVVQALVKNLVKSSICLTLSPCSMPNLLAGTHLSVPTLELISSSEYGPLAHPL